MACQPRILWITSAKLGGLSDKNYVSSKRKIMPVRDKNCVGCKRRTILVQAHNFMACKARTLWLVSSELSGL